MWHVSTKYPAELQEIFLESAAETLLYVCVCMCVDMCGFSKWRMATHNFTEFPICVTDKEENVLKKLEQKS